MVTSSMGGGAWVGATYWQNGFSVEATEGAVSGVLKLILGQLEVGPSKMLVPANPEGGGQEFEKVGSLLSPAGKGAVARKGFVAAVGKGAAAAGKQKVPNDGGLDGDVALVAAAAGRALCC